MGKDEHPQHMGRLALLIPFGKTSALPHGNIRQGVARSREQLRLEFCSFSTAAGDSQEHELFGKVPSCFSDQGLVFGLWFGL